ncbi:GatB/YqeY [Candidatus Saccharibacteria bacterium]|nr:MAG: GatB/YqeY [Candidatus Saccharibacteria bacterium]PID98833.1 MAG: GatB/YqeY [Candidatus Saccharibacteria bacterium]
MLKQRLQDDIKAAMLSGDAERLECLRGLKSAILYAEVATGKRQDGLHDDEIIALFAKEAKKRQESAELYVQGGSQERADKELAEKAIIEAYLPAQLSEEELGAIIDEVISQVKPEGLQQMGQVIGRVKSQVGNTADGSMIAKLVKEKLQA